jgi:branched-chain amino acid transport system substrate-binding protein
LLFTIAAHPDLTANNVNIIRMLPTSIYYAKRLSFYVSKYFNKPSIGILFANDDFGNSLKEAFKEIYTQNNGEIIISNSYEKDKIDYRSEVTKILNKKPNSIFLVGYGKDLGAIIKQFRELGYLGEIFSTPEISYPDVKTVAGETYDNIYYITMKVDENTKVLKQFHSIYSNEYKTAPSLDSYLSYDEVSIIYKSILSGKSDFFENNIDSMTQIVKSIINNYSGITGRLNVDKNGDVYFPLFLKSIKNGKEIPLDFETEKNSL